MDQPKPTITVMFDGGVNPDKTGYGSALITQPNGKDHLLSRIQFPRTMTSNEAEYSALIAGLVWVCETYSAELLARTDLIIKGDSQLVIYQMIGKYQVRHVNMRPMHQRAKELVSGFKTVSCQWHRRENSVAAFGH